MNELEASTPYDRGREWMQHKGPFAHLNCTDAINAFGLVSNSDAHWQFMAGTMSIICDGLADEEL